MENVNLHSRKVLQFFPMGLHLVATLKLKEVKALNTISYKELQQNFKKNLKTSKKRLKKEN